MDYIRSLYALYTDLYMLLERFHCTHSNQLALLGYPRMWVQISLMLFRKFSPFRKIWKDNKYPFPLFFDFTIFLTWEMRNTIGCLGRPIDFHKKSPGISWYQGYFG